MHLAAESWEGKANWGKQMVREEEDLQTEVTRDSRPSWRPFTPHRCAVGWMSISKGWLSTVLWFLYPHMAPFWAEELLFSKQWEVPNCIWVWPVSVVRGRGLSWRSLGTTVRAISVTHICSLHTRGDYRWCWRKCSQYCPFLSRSLPPQ